MIQQDVIASNPFFAQTPAAPHAAPANFQPHTVRREYLIDKSHAAVWAWLNDPKTFTDSQIPPWRVEFVSADPETPPGFYEGGLNVHHGPWTLFAGTMTEIREGEYRDLQYFYGSYFLSVRLVRPTRLQFWVEETGPNQTKVILQLDSLVKKWFVPVWSFGNRYFWSRFGRWASNSA
ncbi:MAG: hypothetical protein AAGD96_21255 [Chloroflexota bacterium]